MVPELDGAAGMKRVVLTGSESTGKSELTPRLAAHFGVPWVPEYVRGYASRKGAPLTADDVERVARGQMALEDAVRSLGAKLLIQDTDLLSTLVYARHYYGIAADWLVEEVRERLPDLYLLMDIDVPWVADGVRDRGDRRDEMQELFRGELARMGARYVEIRGKPDERLASAIRAIEPLAS